MPSEFWARLPGAARLARTGGVLVVLSAIAGCAAPASAPGDAAYRNPVLGDVGHRLQNGTGAEAMSGDHQ